MKLKVFVSLAIFIIAIVRVQAEHNEFNETINMETSEEAELSEQELVSVGSC
jgi:hypothetical protein